MGLCFSLQHDVVETPTAKVVSISGGLREYAVPAAVSLVLQAEKYSSFLCNSDHLCYDDHIPAMDPADHLQPDQLYFVLPESKLHHRLSSQDMAALAVKASLALQNNDTRRRRRYKNNNNNKSRISPVLLVQAQSEATVAKPPAKMEKGARISRSGGGSMSRRFNKLSSRRARLAVRSFRLRLSTIHEGLVLSSTAAAANTHGHT